MSKSRTSRLRASLNALLREAGFNKVGSRWYRENDEVIVVIELQKSRYDLTFLLNVGLWVLALGAPEVVPPRERDCHLRFRGDNWFGEAGYVLLQAMSLETALDDAERFAQLGEVFREHVIPEFKELQRGDVLLARIRDNARLPAFVHRDLRDLANVV